MTLVFSRKSPECPPIWGHVGDGFYAARTMFYAVAK
nr:MAG TPA: hypothetical protein [Caudoviricetes sp.]